MSTKNPTCPFIAIPKIIQIIKQTGNRRYNSSNEAVQSTFIFRILKFNFAVMTFAFTLKSEGNIFYKHNCNESVQNPLKQSYEILHGLHRI